MKILSRAFETETLSTELSNAYTIYEGAVNKFSEPLSNQDLAKWANTSCFYYLKYLGQVENFSENPLYIIKCTYMHAYLN